MPVSVFELFRIGIGPSSSHTVGPMRAARRFAQALAGKPVAGIVVELYGSLALTGKGHATDHAVMLGLMGHSPETADAQAVEGLLAGVRASGRLRLADGGEVPFREGRELLFLGEQTLPQHPNGMRFIARDPQGRVLREELLFSIGGGFVLSAEEMAQAIGAEPPVAWPHPYRSAEELLRIGRASGKRIAAIALENELAQRTLVEVEDGLDRIRGAMRECMDRGLAAEGVLPGGLQVPRRAKKMHERLLARQQAGQPLPELDWVNAFAVAVNEENASGGRVVTAPTNGAAGIVPAVLRFYERFCPGACAEGERDYLLVAAAIGSLYKENASISGAEVGCQGEVGVASSMAAAGLAAVLGGSNEQVENAAEIGMEHNLGLTCDPVGGLVQIPCIERNAMGAVKAINAAWMALSGDGRHQVSLDKVIETMRRTGADMHHKYKETSLGGLAVSVVDC